VDSAYKLEGVRTKASNKKPEGEERHGLWKCRECRNQFTVRQGTIFEESHQLHRFLGITYKSAWFLTHRLL